MQPRFADNITDDIAQLHIHFEERLLHVMNSLSAPNYQVVAQAHIGSQFANLLIGTKGPIQKPEVVKLLNPLAIQHVSLGSAWHVLYMACINHPDFKAMLLQNFVKTDPVNTR
jgi:hypothetical protein